MSGPLNADALSASSLLLLLCIICLRLISVIYLLVDFLCCCLSLYFLKPSAQPEWLQVMSDSEVEISSELHWSCVAAGKPRPSVRWLRNGQPLSTQVTYKACCLCTLYTSALKVTIVCFFSPVGFSSFCTSDGVCGHTQRKHPSLLESTLKQQKVMFCAISYRITGNTSALRKSTSSWFFTEVEATSFFLLLNKKGNNWAQRNFTFQTFFIFTRSMTGKSFHIIK